MSAEWLEVLYAAPVWFPVLFGGMYVLIFD